MTKELELLTRLFTLGYLAGHENAVEGTFMDVHPSDWNTYFIDEDVVKEAAATLAKTQEGEVPSPSNWLTGILAKVPTMVLTDSMIRGIEAEAYRAMNNDKHRAKAEARLIAQQKAPEGGSKLAFALLRDCESAVRRAGWASGDYQLGHEARMLAESYERGDFEVARNWVKRVSGSPTPDSAAPGGDVETRGHIAMLRSLRLMYEDGVMGEGDHVGTISALDAAIAALSAPKQVGVAE